jgi:hypothetical protein
MSPENDLDQVAINTVRALAIDAIQKATRVPDRRGTTLWSRRVGAVRSRPVCAGS